MAGSLAQSLTPYFQRKMLGVLCLGFASGLPFPLAFATLSFWLAESDISKKEIGLFALLSTPYVIKFLWAPFVDHIRFPILNQLFGLRRGWIIGSQVLLCTTILLLGLGNPQESLGYMAVMALLLAFFSATQDIAIDALRIESVDDEEQGMGSAAVVFGWRIGALVSGAGTLYIAEYTNWFTAYASMAVILLLSGIASLALLKEPKREATTLHNYNEWIGKAIIKPFAQFMTENRWFPILIFIIIFKMGDAIALSMLSPFVVDLGFSKDEYASIAKIFGTAATFFGAFAGGLIVHRYGIIGGLWICGICQMLSTLMFVVQAIVGHDLAIFTLTIALENFASGMGTAAFVAYLSYLCHKDYTATQYALFSALAAVARTWFSGAAGYMVESFDLIGRYVWFAGAAPDSITHIGWILFFGSTVLLAIPGLLMLPIIGRSYKKLT